MSIEETEIWANSLVNLAAPPVGKVSAGFDCGDADPDLFNWVLQKYGQGIFELQESLTVSLTDIEDGLSTNEGRLDDLDLLTRGATQNTVGITRYANDFDVATFPPVDNRAITPRSLFEHQTRYGAHWHRYTNSDARWTVLEQDRNIPTVDITKPSPQQTKGVYFVSCTTPDGQFGVTFDVIWKRIGTSPDIYYSEQVIRRAFAAEAITVALHIDISGGDNDPSLMSFAIRRADGSADATYQISDIQELFAPELDAADFSR